MRTPRHRLADSANTKEKCSLLFGFARDQFLLILLYSETTIILGLCLGFCAEGEFKMIEGGLSAILGLTHFFLFCHSRVGGNPIFGRFLTPWILVPRLREDKLHGNDTDCVSPNNFVLTLSACHQENRYDRTYFLHAWDCCRIAFLSLFVQNNPYFCVAKTTILPFGNSPCIVRHHKLLTNFSNCVLFL